MNKNFLLILFSTLLVLSGCAEKDYLVTITTKYGDMKLVLFDKTPLHKQTFLEMAEAGKYDSTIFHRVMQGFMVQGGDINRKKGNVERENTLIPAEFRTEYVHHKGMLSGARTPDNVNPEKKSGTQFFIVQGRTYTRAELDSYQEEIFYGKCVNKLNQIFQSGGEQELLSQLIELQKQNDVEAVRELVFENVGLIESQLGKVEKIEYTNEQYELYEEIGGAPHLDGDYTVYGKVVEGLAIIDSIAAQPVAGTTPVEEIFMTVSVEAVAQSKLEKLYGITYPSESQ